jgi:hypothetical protein
MTILLWTRDNAARDAIELALSRMGMRYERCTSVEDVAGACARLDTPAALVFGPSFSRSEAERLVEESHAEHLALVLLEDPLDPMHSAVLEPLSVRRRLPLPVRLRALRAALEALAGDPT